MSASNWSERASYFIAGRRVNKDDPLTYWEVSRVLLSLTTYVLLTIFLCSAAVGVWSAYQDASQKYQEEKQNAATQRQQAYNRIAERCAVIAPSEHFIRGCLFEALGSYESQKKTDQDLKAQQDMAFWAFWMFIATIGSLTISVGGLIMLFLSLRQTRTAIADNRELGEKETRAYLSVKFDPRQRIAGDNDGKPDFEVYVENVGSSPARNLRFIATTDSLKLPLPVPCGDLGFGVGFGPDSSIIDLAKGETLPLGIDHRLSWKDIAPLLNPKSESKYVVFGIVWYEDVFAMKHKRRFCFIGQVVSKPGAKPVAIGFSAANAHNDET